MAVFPVRLLSASLVAGSVLAACATTPASPPAAVQPAPARSMTDILAAAPASDWRAVDPENTIYLELASGRVVIELAPAFAPGHVANIKALSRDGYFRNAAIVRVQDNYVVQWSQPASPPPPLTTGKATLPAEFDQPRAAIADFLSLPDPDSYAPETGLSGGFPAARNASRTWLAHCYGMVGAGRDTGADTGGGAELYAVIGQSPRHLDRNVTLVGRILQGVELLSPLPRGTGDLGFYTDPAQNIPIRDIVVAADLPADRRTPLEALRTDSATYAAVLESRRFRRDGWFIDPVGHINVCNAPLPVRAAASGG